MIIEKQGSFYVNAETIVSNFPSGVGNPVPGQIAVSQMYVEYQIPQTKGPRAYPIVMVHGAWHTGKTYDETPDGREGWRTYFLRQGFPVYVVDHVGRGRSDLNPTPSNQAKVQNNTSLIPNFAKATYESAWTLFRIGPAPFTPNPGTQFPVNSWDQYAAQIVTNTETSLEPSCSGLGTGCALTTSAIAALLDRIGPAIVMVHSQSGRFGISAAIARPDKVKAVVGIEPTSCAVSANQVQSVFTKVAFLSVFGDFVPGSIWAGIMNGCASTANAIQTAGGVAEHVVLPDRGMYGNSHMMMMDRNSLEIADLLVDWIRDNVR